MFSPVALLTLLCCTTVLLFGDRGAVSSNSITGDPDSGIRRDFGISVAESGWVYAAGMIGLAVSAPVSAHLSTTTNALRLVGVGVLFASAGSFCSAFASSFPILLASRVIAGIGAGPFISLASPLIDDSAPRHRRSAFLACLFVCIPIGFSGGYIYSTLIASIYGWRAVFLLEGMVMAPFAAIALLINNPNDISRRGCYSREDEDEEEGAFSSPSKTGFFKGITIILRLPALVLTMLALVCLNGSLGGFSFYGSKAAKSIFNLKSSTADLLFGGSTVITGIVGTLLGGMLLDLMGSNVKSALLLCILGVGAAAGGLAVSFAATSKLSSFSPGFLLGETAMFISSAPAIAVMLWTSPANLRPTALAVSEILNHVLGDVPLPVILGMMQQRWGNWRLTMCVCTAILGCSAAMFAFARCAVTKELVEWEEEVVVVAASGGCEEENVGLDGVDLEEPLMLSRE
ncbi:putative sphingolipid transporter spinster-like protein 2 [Nannochloris sp. 'desiccata']|nr:hypothetical protein KSW81_000416 [Chlorella desiccata (nom. nud.)]KAH7620951.1 putative sphingolipid transporter spinster-like protein 2 [Chlorella desiccata (nom. nud.)]